MMIVMIVGENESGAAELKARLHQAGVDCPQGSIISIETAQTLLEAGQPVEVLFVLESDSPARLTEHVRALRSATRAAIVAVGHGIDTSGVLDVVRAGASDYLDTAGNGYSDLAIVLDRSKAGGPRSTPPGKAICIVAASGGCGTSTLAVNLGAALGKPNRACCLIDLKLRGGDLATLLNLPAQRTIVDLIVKGNLLDAALFRQTLIEHAGHMQILASPPLLSDHGCIGARVVTQILEFARAMFPFVVVDLEDVVHREQICAVRNCDVLLIVLRLDFPCLFRARRMLDYFRQKGIDTAKIHLVANRVVASSMRIQTKAIEGLGMSFLEYLPEDQAAMIPSVNIGNPVVLETPQARIAKSYSRLADLLLTL